MIGRDGEADELCYVMYMFYSLLLAIYYGCNSRRSGYDAVPDKMKIKDDVTELWSLFIRHQHDGLSPIFISFSGIIKIRLLDMRIARSWNKKRNDICTGLRINFIEMFCTFFVKKFATD